VNPGTGPELEALYRLSWKCTTSPSCRNLSQRAHDKIRDRDFVADDVGYERRRHRRFVYSKSQSQPPAP